MKSSAALRSPVLTFLSSSPSTSQRTQELFRVLFSLEPLSLPRSTLEQNIKNGESNGVDSLNDFFSSTIPGFTSRKWESVASQCPTTGTIVHLLSPTTRQHTTNSNNNDDDNSVERQLSLLSVSCGPMQKSSPDAPSTATIEAIQQSRHLLASHMKERTTGMNRLKLSTIGALGRTITTSHILDDGLPLIDLPEKRMDSPSGKNCVVVGGLKEFVIPHYDFATYSQDGSSLLSRLSSSSTLTRPVVGLYKWDDTLSIRPLPAAQEDRSLPPPSLIFHYSNFEDLDEMEEKLQQVGAISSKIGYTGTGKRGQLLVRHKDINGIDIRFCESTEYSSNFAEAQEALLASSLEELQNVNVMLEGKEGSNYEGMDGNRGKVDVMNGLGDCWVEFRANMKKPSGFLNRKGNARSSAPRTAKAPEIPYE